MKAPVALFSSGRDAGGELLASAVATSELGSRLSLRDWGLTYWGVGRA